MNRPKGKEEIWEVGGGRGGGVSAKLGRERGRRERAAKVDGRPSETSSRCGSKPF